MTWPRLPRLANPHYGVEAAEITLRHEEDRPEGVRAVSEEGTVYKWMTYDRDEEGEDTPRPLYTAVRALNKALLGDWDGQ